MHSPALTQTEEATHTLAYSQDRFGYFTLTCTLNPDSNLYQSDVDFPSLAQLFGLDLPQHLDMSYAIAMSIRYLEKHEGRVLFWDDICPVCGEGVFGDPLPCGHRHNTMILDNDGFCLDCGQPGCMSCCWACLVVALHTF